MNIDGVYFESSEVTKLCIINSFSDELADILKNNLVSICEGGYRNLNQDGIYTYERTIKELYRRIIGKPEKMKKGMVGELLAHVLLKRYITNLIPMSPLFNLEESNIKKGFDIIYTDLGSRDVWITEVKSGNRGDEESANKKNISLLKNAKKDLEESIKGNKSGRWRNALNGVDISQRNKNETKYVQNILKDGLDAAEAEKGKSDVHNAILVSVVYSNVRDPIDIEVINKDLSKICNAKVFKEFILFSIQKSTYQKVINFIKAEASNEY